MAGYGVLDYFVGVRFTRFYKQDTEVNSLVVGYGVLDYFVEVRFTRFYKQDTEVDSLVAGYGVLDYFVEVSLAFRRLLDIGSLCVPMGSLDNLTLS